LLLGLLLDLVLDERAGQPLAQLRTLAQLFGPLRRRGRQR